jgi:hypothetical protein
VNLPPELQDIAEHLKEEVEQEVGPTCVMNKCKVRLFQRESDGDIQIRFTHYCGRKGHLTPL